MPEFKDKASFVAYSLMNQGSTVCAISYPTACCL